MSPLLIQYPYPVRAPASIAAVREDGSILYKSSIPVPLEHVSATALMTRQVFRSVEGNTNQSLPSSAAGVTSG